MPQFKRLMTISAMLLLPMSAVGEDKPSEGERSQGIGVRPGPPECPPVLRPNGDKPPRVDDRTSVGDKYIKAFPPAKEGMLRYVIELPKKPQGEEKNYQVELIVGKEIIADGVNQIWFMNRIETKPLKGWGFSYYEVANLSNRGSTAVRPPPELRQVKRFVATPSIKIRYNSRLPIVVYVPEGGVVRYRIWKASETTENAEQG